MIRELFPDDPPADPRFVCPTCQSKGFAPSILPGSCTFCDGTEGGNPPTPDLPTTTPTYWGIDRSHTPELPVRTVRTVEPSPVASKPSRGKTLAELGLLEGESPRVPPATAASGFVPPGGSVVTVEGDPPPAQEAAELTVDQLLSGLPFAYLQGAAGTGKTYLARQVIQARDDAILCATTGIAAVNLGDATTLNSVLAYFDTQSLMEHYASGFLQYRLRMLRKSGIRTLVVDEISMMAADQLTILCQAFDELDQQKTYDQDLGVGYQYADGDLRMKLLLVGDFAQLPPIDAPFAFESPEWGRFQEKTFKLETVRRTGDQSYIDALHAVRKGNGQAALAAFEPRMVQGLDFSFDGTTIVATNPEVDRINGMRHSKLPGDPYSWKTIRSGEQQKDWLKQIPEQVDLKLGALVMILANRPRPRDDAEGMAFGDLLYANGDLATVVGNDPHGIRVMLHRTFEELTVIPAVKEWKEPTGKKNPRFTIKGAVSYMPLRLAYATTVHKSQGLSLDRVQVSLIHGMFHKPGMTYVALSRCRSLEGLRIVGNPKMFLGRCGVSEKVKGYL